MTGLPPDLNTSLNSESERQINLNLLGAWLILLWRLTGDREPITFVSQPLKTASLSEPDENERRGLFPLRISINGETTVAELLQLIESSLLGSAAYPGESRKSVFELIADCRNAMSVTEFQFGSADSTNSSALMREEDCFPDLSVWVIPGSSLTVQCVYDTRLFSGETINLWLNSYLTILKSVLTASETALETLPLHDQQMFQAIQAKCNNTQMSPLPARNIPELIANAFAQASQQPAVEFYGLRWSRARLTERVDRLASWLLRHGVGPGSLVGIFMDRSMEMLLAVLAVLKSGAAYVPLDPKFPVRRVQQIFEETDFPILLTLSRHTEDLLGFRGLILSLDGKATELNKEPIQAFPPISPEMRAYVIFTSGSTGRPKGVEITHGAVVNLLVDLKQRLELTSQDRLLAVTTLSFDISVLELFLPLFSGGTVVIAAQEDTVDGIRLVELLEESRATVLQATPFTWRILLESGFEPPQGFKMLCGGEAWLPAMAERLLANGGGRLWNMYGPTETTVWSSVTEISPRANRISIGPPIANTRFYVLDEDLKPVPPGIRGELFIAGSGVARGYFKRDELTTEKFLSDPFVPDERMYRTGDEVRQLIDGKIEFLGRLDQQIKLRGYRIELGEIEATMAQFLYVKDAVVVVVKDAEENDVLAGYFIAESDVSSAQMRDWLQESLPAYMVPRVIEQLEEFPVTPNGKTDRRAISAMKNGNAQSAEVIVETSSLGAPIEQQMLGIWSKIFQDVPLKSESNFFDIGGDSLSLVRLQSLVTRHFGVHLTMSDITRYPTFGQLAAWVDKMQKNVPADPVRPTNPRLLPVHSNGNSRPIFLLPQMMIFWPFAEELGDEQTVFALQLLDEDVTVSTDSTSFEDLAKLYCKLIREAQPEGPYRLGGWCLWGLMSYEIARTLEAQGQKVELLMIIDAWAPGHWKGRSPIRKLLMSFAYNLHRLRWMTGRLRYGTMQTRKKDVIRRIQSIATLSSLLPEAMRSKNPERESSVVEKMVSVAVVSYEPKPIDGNVVVFKGEQQAAGLFIGEDLGWSNLLGRKVPVDTLPGNHSEIFERAGARVMAARVREILNSE